MASVGAKGRSIGRRSLISPEVTARVADGIREGLPFKLACERAGFVDTTGYQWIRMGEDDERQGRAETPHAAFRRAVTRARTDLFESLVKTVKTAAKKDWRAASWILERRDPDAWSRRTEITGAEGGPIATVDLTAQLDAALKARSSRDLGIPASVLPDERTLDGAALLVSSTGPVRSAPRRGAAPPDLAAHAAPKVERARVREVRDVEVETVILEEPDDYRSRVRVKGRRG